jgi:exo-beta-1,3-glucanase (GH17 family)
MCGYKISSRRERESSMKPSSKTLFSTRKIARFSLTSSHSDSANSVLSSATSLSNMNISGFEFTFAWVFELFVHFSLEDTNSGVQFLESRSQVIFYQSYCNRMSSLKPFKYHKYLLVVQLKVLLGIVIELGAGLG